VKEGRAQAEELSDDNEIPLIVFIGDGVSDLAAAREADVLFARKGLRLEEYCIEHQIPFIGFDTFSDVKKEVEKIIEEDQEETGGMGKPARFNPRANMWRRVSSKQAVSCCDLTMLLVKLLMISNLRFLSSLRQHRRKKRRCSSGQKTSHSTNLNQFRKTWPLR
jgi:hypothetical protein